MDSSVLLFFDSHPAALPLYEKLEKEILSMEPDTVILVQKTQIAFSLRHRFAFVSFLPVRKAALRPRDYITVSFGLSYRLCSPRIDAASEPYPNRWTHHALIAKPEEINGELLGWIREAAVFAQTKRPKR